MRRRFTSLLLFVVICMVFIQKSEVCASDVDNKKKAICDAIEYVSLDAGAFNMKNVDFGKLRISSPIPVYEYKDGIVCKFCNYYPILDKDNHIIALAMSPSEGKYTIETALARDIDMSGCKNVAIIYDSHGAYLYDGEEVTLLGSAGLVISGRDTINVQEFNLRSMKIETADISESFWLGYRNTNGSAKAQTYYSCGVSYVTQLPYSNLCWAASVACINNYRNGTSLTASSVSMDRFGTTYVVDMTEAPSNVATLMQTQYGLNGYTFNNYIPSSNTILNNISNGYPIYGSFRGQGGYHAVTIFGCNPISGYISVMDPMTGSTSAVANGTTYWYVSSYTGTTLSLARGIWHS